jgi:acetylornithine/succinyldiaminopimelate/putrescine aminotransferase
VFTPGTHGSTFGGNPVACAAAAASLEALADPALLEHVQAMGRHFTAGLERLARRHDCIRAVRGLGLMIGAELDRPGQPIVADCLQRGLLVNCTADRVLRFLPPLIVGREEIDEALAILDQALPA